MNSGFLTRCEERIQPLFIIAQFAFVFPFLLPIARLRNAVTALRATKSNFCGCRSDQKIFSTFFL